MTTFRAIQYLSKELKAQKLPSSRPFIRLLEDKGILPRPNNDVGFKTKTGKKETNNMRLYTDEEITKISSILKKWITLTDAEKKAKLS